MLKIRLKRVGRKHDPSYRIIVTEDFRGSKSGKYIEKIGGYDPRKDTKQIDVERVKYWISKGAQVSDTVHNILVSEKVIDGSKKNVVSEKKLAKNKEKKEEAKNPPTPEAMEDKEKEDPSTTSTGSVQEGSGQAEEPKVEKESKEEEKPAPTEDSSEAKKEE